MPSISIPRRWAGSRSLRRPSWCSGTRTRARSRGALSAVNGVPTSVTPQPARSRAVTAPGDSRWLIAGLYAGKETGGRPRESAGSPRSFGGGRLLLRQLDLAGLLRDVGLDLVAVGERAF